MQRIYWDAINVNGQKVFYTVTDQGLNFVSSPEVGVSQILDFYPLAQFEYVHAHRATDHYRKALKKYLKGKRDTLAFPLADFEDSDEQQRAVWQQIQQIPYGKTASLADLATQLQLPTTAVVSAMQVCPVWLAVPMHRVVNRGQATGFRTDAQIDAYLREVESKPKTELKELIKKA
ncbi:methylated-DNA--[protein]-cysteine S-methyltransferase [Fructilactobacillus frigidiflavus]|uniref:methylated-DNA--[protein]-cysteine S-methyltransferase n=1 Tax=Fructilactobacillus frigidiflavus TaxID=3242688 RepID=UPI003757FFC4